MLSPKVKKMKPTRQSVTLVACFVAFPKGVIGLGFVINHAHAPARCHSPTA